ncbi:MAG TPA: hypothetical protein VH307_31235 [Streptosporangiaceae bacterium]|nr:hypothetical protein [Streptosporangiaceae bacterium]
MSLVSFSRKEFLAERWAPSPKEQVFIVQPTQGGKTHFAFDLLNNTQHAKPPVTLVMKPRDPTPSMMTRKWGWKEIDRWPPPKVWPWQDQPPGYTLWPKHSLSLDPASIAKSNANLKRQFERCLMGAYSGGDQVVFVDEIYGLLAELQMKQVIEALSTRGSGMKATMWYATQKPSGTIGAPMPGHLFNNPRHLFLGYDPVAANRRRFSEIGGINTDVVTDAVENLKMVPVRTPDGVNYISELLYINKNGPRGGYMCIVEAP